MFAVHIAKKQMRVAVIISNTLFLTACAQSSDAARAWKAVPDHSGVFVDMASIAPVAISNFPYKSCVPGPAPTGPCKVPLDTKADVKVERATVQGVHFWCKNLDEKTVDEIGIVNGKSFTIPMAATKLVVCGVLK